jgi:hypothetical protein
MIRIAIYGALAGFFVPVLIMAITYLQGGVFEWPYMAVALWPSSIILMGTDGRELTPAGIIIFVISVLLNQAVYAGIGAIAAYFYVRILASK